MSFDDLFGLLLFVVFIAVPALSRLSRSKKSGGGAPPGQGAAGQGRSPAAPPGGSATAKGGDELERRLAEARARVRRALEGPQGASPTPASGPAQAAGRSSAAAPAARRGAFVSASRDDGLLSTPFDAASLGMLGERAQPVARSRPTRFEEAPALQVERPGARVGRASAAFATDPETIRSAIIWHQVLGEPLARRKRGGRTSTLRSR